MGLFLLDQVGFYDIPRLVKKAMDTVPFRSLPDLTQILEADRLGTGGRVFQPGRMRICIFSIFYWQF